MKSKNKVKQSRSSQKVIEHRVCLLGFQVGFQTTLSSSIQCQGMEVLLDGSMQRGIVQHTEYVVTVEEEIFTKNHEHLIARSSSEKLKCNPHGPSLRCVGALHTYAWNLPKTSCLFQKVRELEGLFSTWPFMMEEAQIYYELKGFQNIPLGCGGHQGYLTNVQDKYNEELSNAVKLQSLALFLR